MSAASLCGVLCLSRRVAALWLLAIMYAFQPLPHGIP